MQFAIWHSPVERAAAGIGDAMFDDILETLGGVATLWNRYIDSDARIDIRLYYEDLAGPATLAAAGPIFYGSSFSPLTSDVFAELTGSGGTTSSELDATLTIDVPKLLDGTLALNDGYEFTTTGLGGGWDLLSVLLHEVGHILGVNDLQMEPFRTDPTTFDGPSAGSVPLTDGVHLGIDDLMAPALYPQTREVISSTDIAILRDLGVPIKAAGAGNDYVYGFELEDDSLVGLGGNDTLIGLTGDDTLDGGAGDRDMARFRGDFADFTYSENPDGSWTFTDLNTADGYDEGTDRLIGIEKVKFGDDTIITLDPTVTSYAPVAKDDSFVIAERTLHEPFFGAILWDLGADNGNGEDVKGYYLSEGFITIQYPIPVEISHVNGVPVGEIGTLSVAPGIDLSFFGQRWVYFTLADDFPDMSAGETIEFSFSYTLESNTPGAEDGHVSFTIFGEDDDLRTAGISAASFDTGPGNDWLRGNAGADTLDAGDGDDSIDGGGEADVLSGGFGNDTINGENGDDTAHGESDDDLMTGGAGRDTMHGGLGNDEMHGDDGKDLLLGGSGDDLLFGGQGTDVLLGGSGNDRADGGGGADLIEGRDGKDLLFGGVGGDTIAGDAGTDVLDGGAGDDLLLGGGGADSIDGGIGLDTILGGPGSDTIVGGTDADVMTGEGGADRFVFAEVSDSPAGTPDVITDFVAGEDVLDFGSVVPGVLELHLLEGYSGAAPGMRTQETSLGDTVVRVDADGDGSTDMRVILAGVTGLTENDFLL